MENPSSNEGPNWFVYLLNAPFGQSETYILQDFLLLLEIILKTNPTIFLNQGTLKNYAK